LFVFYVCGFNSKRKERKRKRVKEKNQVLPLGMKSIFKKKRKKKNGRWEVKVTAVFFPQWNDCVESEITTSHGLTDLLNGWLTG